MVVAGLPRWKTGIHWNNAPQYFDRLEIPEAVCLGACPRLDESTADALDLARSSDPSRSIVQLFASNDRNI